MPNFGPQSKAPFSFHCTICYESLNLTDRAPVVLPCGHTYICEQCAKRLDKCMECRMPLTKVVKLGAKKSVTPQPGCCNSHSQAQQRKPMSQTSTFRFSYNSGGARKPENKPKPPAIEKEVIALPIPKNQVLMSLIDAAQNNSTEDHDEKDGYESGDDDERVLQGMQMMGGSSGTYVVREESGLKVHPIKKPSNWIPEEDEEDAAVKILSQGQALQIFSFENGIATIARGAGYILVDKSCQLVKVGEVTDEACKLEAMNQVLSSQLEELEKDMRRIRRAQDSVTCKLQEVLADTNTAGDNPFGPAPTPTNISDREHTDKVGSNEQDDDSPLVDSPPYEQTPVSVLSTGGSVEPSRSIEKISNHAVRLHKQEVKENEIQVASHDSYIDSFWPLSFGKTPKTTTQQLYYASGEDQEATTSNYIDFKSGFSGHRGLNRAQAHALNQSPPHRQVMMMSHHQGVGYLARKPTW